MRFFGVAARSNSDSDPSANRPKGKSGTDKITAALEPLKTLPFKSVTITGDAIFTQRAICQTIIDGGGDYFFAVKGNQPGLKANIE